MVALTFHDASKIVFSHSEFHLCKFFLLSHIARVARVWHTRLVLCTVSWVSFQPCFCNLLGRGQTFFLSYVQSVAFSEVAMEWQTGAVLPLLFLLVSLPFSQPGAVQFDPSTIDSTIANYEFVFVNFYADW